MTQKSDLGSITQVIFANFIALTEYLAEQDPTLVRNILFTVLAVTLSLSIVRRYLVVRKERAISYKIETPIQCQHGWKGEEMDVPSIKVLYNPSYTRIKSC